LGKRAVANDDVKSARPDEPLDEKDRLGPVWNVDIREHANLSSRAGHSSGNRAALASIHIQRDNLDTSGWANRKTCQDLLAVVRPVIDHNYLRRRDAAFERISQYPN
jgi:hypothetical protein